MTMTHQRGDTTMDAHLSFKALRFIVGLAFALGAALGGVLGEHGLSLALQVVSLLAAK